MKKGMLAAMLLGIVSSMVFAETEKTENANDASQPIEIILEAPGLTKGQLYSSIKPWMAETRLARFQIMAEDKDSGRVIAKGDIKMPCAGKDTADCAVNEGVLIDFDLRIDTKDGKIRMIFTNLVRNFILVKQAGLAYGLDQTKDRILHPDGREAITTEPYLKRANLGARALSDGLLASALKQFSSEKW